MRFIVALSVVFALALTSCRTSHTCPTYMKNTPVNKDITVSVTTAASERM